MSRADRTGVKHGVPPKVWLGVGLLALVGGVVILSARGPSDPEAQIRAAIEASRQSAEAKKLGGVMEIVSEEFSSPPMTRRDLQQAVFIVLQRAGVVRVQVLDQEIDLGSDAEEADVRLTALLARTAGDWTTLDPKDMSAYRFDVHMKRESAGWKVRQLQYQPAKVQDLLPRILNP
ncbi:MAG: hypothetical protein U1E65_07310 [Myxococcota bacterium]